jgi:hypothetical protein
MKVAFIAVMVALLGTSAANAAQYTLEQFIEMNGGKPFEPPGGAVTTASTAMTIAYAIMADGAVHAGVRVESERQWKAKRKAVLENGIWRIFFDNKPVAGKLLVGSDGCSIFISQADARFLGAYCTQ